MRKPQFLVLLIVSLTAMLGYLFWERHVNYDAIHTIKYVYDSAPVSPDYQFNYEVIVTRSEINFTTTNYEQEITDAKKVSIDLEDFQAIKDALDEFDINNCEDLVYDCDGGDHLSIYGYNESGEEILRNRIYRCASNGRKCGSPEDFYEVLTQILNQHK